MKTYGIYGYYNLPRAPWGWTHHHPTGADNVKATTAKEALKKYLAAHPEIDEYGDYKLWAMEED